MDEIALDKRISQQNRPGRHDRHGHFQRLRRQIRGDHRPRCHHRLAHPVHIAEQAVQIVLQRHQILVGDKEQRVIPVVPIGQCDKQADRGECGLGQRQNKPDINLEIPRPVDFGGFDDRFGNAAHERFHHNDIKHVHQHRQDQYDQRILKLQVIDDQQVPGD
ncbi:hypothetical protein D1872_234510 [compost metagenome]